MEGQENDSTLEAPGGRLVGRRLFFSAVIGVNVAAVGYYGFLRKWLGPQPFEVTIDGPFAPLRTIAIPEVRDSLIKIHEVKIGKLREHDCVRVRFSFDGGKPEDRAYDMTLTLKDPKGKDFVRRTVKCSDVRVIANRGPYSSSGTISIPKVSTRFFACDRDEINRASKMMLRLE